QVGFGGLLNVLSYRPITIFRAAPSLLRALCQHRDLARSAIARLRIAQTYGEPLLKSDVTELREILPPSCLIRTTYGSTEASGLSWFAGEPDDYDPTRVAPGSNCRKWKQLCEGLNPWLARKWCFRMKTAGRSSPRLWCLMSPFPIACLNSFAGNSRHRCRPS